MSIWYVVLVTSSWTRHWLGIIEVHSHSLWSTFRRTFQWMFLGVAPQKWSLSWSIESKTKSWIHHERLSIDHCTNCFGTNSLWINSIKRFKQTNKQKNLKLFNCTIWRYYNMLTTFECISKNCLRSQWQPKQRDINKTYTIINIDF